MPSRWPGEHTVQVHAVEWADTRASIEGRRVDHRNEYHRTLHQGRIKRMDELGNCAYTLIYQLELNKSHTHAHQSALQCYRSNLQSKIYNLKWQYSSPCTPAVTTTRGLARSPASTVYGTHSILPSFSRPTGSVRSYRPGASLSQCNESLPMIHLRSDECRFSL